MRSMVAMPQTADIGLVGMGVMGENLALNLADHGCRVALWMDVLAALEEPLPGIPHARLGTSETRDIRASQRRR